MPILLLDLGNVLLDVDFGRVENAPNIEQFSYSAAKVLHDTGRLSSVDFLSELEDQVEGKVNRNQLKHQWMDMFSWHEGSREFLMRVKDQYKLWLISDTDPLHITHVLNNFPELRLFDRFVLSYVTGYIKLDAKAFAEVLEHKNETGEDFLFIDDKPENIEVARSANIESILFTGWEPVYKRLGIQG